MTQQAPLIDRPAARAGFERHARRLGKRSFIAAETGRRLAARMTALRPPRGPVLDLGCGPEPGADLLQAQPKAEIFGVDWCASMLPSDPPCAAADIHRLPFAAASFAVVWASLVLPWSFDPPRLLAEARRVLVPGGLLMISTLGPGSLAEVQAAFAGADQRGPHVQAFIDMHDLGDLLIACGFAEPVLECERISLIYPAPRRLIDELREAGVLAMPAMRKGLTGRQLWQRATAALARADGRAALSLEGIFAHAWALPMRAPKLADNWQEIKLVPTLARHR